MIFVNAVFLFATFTLAMALFSPLNSFYSTYLLMPFVFIHQFETAWKICPANSTTPEKYNEIFKDFSHCCYELTRNNESICHNFERNIQKCSKPIEGFLVDCLPEKSKDLPPAIVKAATSMVDTFCTSSGEILLEGFNPCIYEFLHQENITIKQQCKKYVLTKKLEKLDKAAPSKSEFCQIIREIGDCWQDTVNKQCNSLNSKEFFSKFYNAAISPCK